MSRWRSVWLVARREILERGRSRGFLFSVAVHDAPRDRVVRGPDRPVRRRGDQDDRRRPAGPGRPRRCTHRDRRPGRPDDRASCPTTMRRPPRPPSTRDASTRCWPSRPTCPPRERSISRRNRIRRSPRSHRRRSSRCGSQGILTEANIDQSELAAAQQAPTVQSLDPQTDADEARFLVRQHRRGADPHRHLQLRLHGPDGRRRGEAEPGRRGRPLDGPAARPADGQGPRHRHPRPRPAARLRRRGAGSRHSLTRPLHAARRRRPARSSC